MTLIDRFLAEHPFFCSLLEHERDILSHYIELYRCPKNSYLVLPNELQEVLWIVVRGRLAERTTEAERTQAEHGIKAERGIEAERITEAERKGPAERTTEAERTQAERITESERETEAERITESERETEAERKTEAGSLDSAVHAALGVFPQEQGGDGAAEGLQLGSASSVGSMEPMGIHQADAREDRDYYASANCAPQIGSERGDEPKKRILRYFFPGDLINVDALTQELIAQNEIVSLEEDTQVISMTTFHLAKLAQQQPKIHRALRPSYNEDGYLVSGLPMPVWQQMNDVPPPYTKDLGKQWLQHKPLMRSYNSWYGSIIALVLLAAANVLQFRILHLATLPFANVAIAVLSVLVLAFVVLQRFRCEYTLKRSVLHITERGLFGLSSKIKSYPLLNVSKAELIKIPVLTRFFKLGGVRLIDHDGELLQVFPLDRPQSWLQRIGENLKAAQDLQEQIQRSRTMQQFKKWHKLQPELIKEINYRNEALEGRLPRSLRALFIRCLPTCLALLLCLYYSLQSDLLRIYLTVPNIGLSAVLLYQLLRWARYTWRISEQHLSRQDNFLGHWNFLRVPIRDIEEAGLEYLNVFGFGSVNVRVDGKNVQLANLKSPQDVLDEIESLRQSEQSQMPGSAPNDNDFLTYKQMEMYHDFNRRHVPR